MQGGKTTQICKKIFDSIPGIKEARWDFEEDYMSLIKNETKLDFVTQCRNLINKIREERISQPFHYPVNRELVQDYYDVIKEPMGKQQSKLCRSSNPRVQSGFRELQIKKTI